MGPTVIGIDPAPVRGGVGFDKNRFYRFKGGVGLKRWLEQFHRTTEKKGEGVLLCWDAPLGRFLGDGVPLYTRPVERFFQKLIKEFNKTGTSSNSVQRAENAGKSISIAPFGNLSHWTISQWVLGYPQFFPAAPGWEPRFRLVTTTEELGAPFSPGELRVVEVHPGLAIWVWLRQRRVKSWRYKKEKGAFKEIVKNLQQIGVLGDWVFEKPVVEVGEDGEVSSPPKRVAAEFFDRGDDDFLDSFICWKLGSLAVTCSTSAADLSEEGGGATLKWTVISDRFSGILLPADSSIEERWAAEGLENCR